MSYALGFLSFMSCCRVMSCFMSCCEPEVCATFMPAELPQDHETSIFGKNFTVALDNN